MALADLITSGQLVAVAVIALLTWWNTRGLTGGKWVQNIFTVAKIGSLFTLVILGLTVATDHAIRSKLLLESLGDSKDAAESADVLSDQQDSSVSVQGLAQTGIDRSTQGGAGRRRGDRAG